MSSLGDDNVPQLVDAVIGVGYSALANLVWGFLDVYPTQNEQRAAPGPLSLAFLATVVDRVASAGPPLCATTSLAQIRTGLMGIASSLSWDDPDMGSAFHPGFTRVWITMGGLSEGDLVVVHDAVASFRRLLRTSTLSHEQIDKQFHNTQPGAPVPSSSAERRAYKFRMLHAFRVAASPLMKEIGHPLL